MILFIGSQRDIDEVLKKYLVNLVNPVQKKVRPKGANMIVQEFPFFFNNDTGQFY